LKYKELIKNYLGINPYTEEIEKELQNEAINLANNFIHLISLSKKIKIEIPSYSKLLSIISIALNYQKVDMLERLKPYLKDERLKVLDEFLDKNNGYKNKYNILLSLEHFRTIKMKFNAVIPLIDNIKITPKVAQYYAKWIEKGKTSQLTQQDKINISFLLLSFVHYLFPSSKVLKMRHLGLKKSPSSSKSLTKIELLNHLKSLTSLLSMR